MKVKSGTQGKVLGREPGRWSVLYWVCYYLVPCIKCKENPEKQWRLGCVCRVWGGLQNSAWYRMHACSSIPPAFPWVSWDLLHTLDPDNTVLSTPGKTLPLSNCPFCVCPSFALPCHLSIPRSSAYSKISQSNSYMDPQRNLQSPL